MIFNTFLHTVSFDITCFANILQLSRCKSILDSWRIICLQAVDSHIACFCIHPCNYQRCYLTEDSHKTCCGHNLCAYLSISYLDGTIRVIKWLSKILYRSNIALYMMPKCYIESFYWYSCFSPYQNNLFVWLNITFIPLSVVINSLEIPFIF